MSPRVTKLRKELKRKDRRKPYYHFPAWKGKRGKAQLLPSTEGLSFTGGSNVEVLLAVSDNHAEKLTGGAEFARDLRTTQMKNG